MKPSITVFGLGNMGTSLVKGLVDADLGSKFSLNIYDLHRDRMEDLYSLGGINKISNLDSFSQQDGGVVFAVKPHDYNILAKTLRGKLANEVLVMSVLAGTTLSQISGELDHQGPVVRAMPNIAATIGCAATAMCGNDLLGSDHTALADLIFKAVGEAYWTKEELMDTVTGLSGSGPAYIFMVIEALTDGGVKMGLPRGLARNLSTQTVLGAASLVKSTGKHPAILKDLVSTPAGTTISALHELESHGLRNMFVSAVQKATERSIELGKLD